MNLQPPLSNEPAELQRLVQDINRFMVTIPELPGPFADDAAAGAARVRVGDGYVDATGLVRRRLA